VPHPQSSTATATYSRKLTKEDGRIDWTKPAQQIEREVRAFAVWPKSYTTLAGRETVILEVQVHNSQGTPGTIDATKKQLIVHCGEGSLEILRLKPAGKPAMSAAAFLAGYRQML
jgi:methionyl-tRNA formyltransferase